MAETLGNGSQVLDITTSANLSHLAPAYVIYEGQSPVRLALFNYVTDPSGANDVNFTFSIGGQPVNQNNGTPAQVKAKYVLSLGICVVVKLTMNGRYLRASSVTQKGNFTWAGQASAFKHCLGCL